MNQNLTDQIMQWELWMQSQIDLFPEVLNEDDEQYYSLTDINKTDKDKKKDKKDIRTYARFDPLFKGLAVTTKNPQVYGTQVQKERSLRSYSGFFLWLILLKKNKKINEFSIEQFVQVSRAKAQDAYQDRSDFFKAELNKEMEKAFKAVEMFCHGDQKESFKVVYDNTHRNTLRHLDECMEDYKKHLVGNVL